MRREEKRRAEKRREDKRREKNRRAKKSIHLRNGKRREAQVI